ncbi:hypothetical protein Tco_0163037 [Tanacetum coccineum]
MRKINFKKAVTQKFKEYDQKLEALTNFNVSKAFKKAIQAKFLTKMKKLLPTHISKAVAKYVRPRLNTFVLELKLLNRIHLNKSNETHTTHQQLYDTLYESITLDLATLNAQDAEPSFYKWSHDNQDSSNNHKGENEKKQRKDVGEPSFRSLKQQYQNDVELEYHVDQLKAIVLTEAKWNIDEDEVSKPRLFDRHKSKYTKPHPSFYNNDFYYLVCLSMEDKWSKETHRYIFEALNGNHWEDSKIDFFKAQMSTRTEGSVYSDLRIKSVVRVVVKKK